MSILNFPKLISSSDTIAGLRYPGFRISSIQTANQNLYVELEPSDLPICPKCAQLCPKVHDVSYRQVRDVPLISTERVYIKFPVRRVRCVCGCRAREQIEWVEPRSRLTNAFVCLVQNYLRMKLPVSEIADDLDLHWDTVKAYDKLVLEYLFSEIDISNLRHIAIDEFALEKKHKYATVVMDLETSRVIWVSRGKTQKSMEPFFQWLKDKSRADQILTVSCDMNAAYPGMVKKHFSKAVILYDFFHVMKMFNENVVVEGKRRCASLIRERIQERSPRKNHGIAAKEILRNEQAGNELKQKLNNLTSSQWLIMKPHSELSEKRQKALENLLKDNELLAALYPIVDLLRQIWQCKIPTESKRLIEYARTLLLAINDKYRFPPAKRFAGMLKRRMAGILQAGKYGYSSGQLEGANNKIKVLKRTAYGYRDFSYFSLKINSVLSGKRDSPWNDLKRTYAVLKDGLWNTLRFPSNS